MIRIILIIVTVIVIIVAGYSGFSYYCYHRVTAKPRPCLEPTSCVSVNGYDLYVRVEGTRTDTVPVIVLHGGPGDSSLSFKDGLAFLAEGRRVLFFDQRGCGRSEVKGPGADLSMEALVSDIEVLRRVVLKSEKVIVFGHSFGGALAQRYAIAHPDRVEQLVLAGSIRVNNGMKSSLLWHWFGPALYSMAMGLPPRDSVEADEWMTAYADAGVPGRMADPANAVKLAGTGAVSFVAWLDITESLVGKDYHEELSRFKSKTLFIFGVHDDVYTGEPVASGLAAIIPEFRMVRFDHSGHWMYLEEPERFKEVLLDFIEG